MLKLEIIKESEIAIIHILADYKILSTLCITKYDFNESIQGLKMLYLYYNDEYVGTLLLNNFDEILLNGKFLKGGKK